MFVMSHEIQINKKSNLFCKVDKHLVRKPDLEDFWNVESIVVMDSTETSDDVKAIERFSETLNFVEVDMKLLGHGKSIHLDLPVNRELSLGRLKSLVNRMKTNQS